MQVDFYYGLIEFCVKKDKRAYLNWLDSWGLVRSSFRCPSFQPEITLHPKVALCVGARPLRQSLIFGAPALMRLSSLCCQGLLLRMAQDGLCSLVLSCLIVCLFPVWLVWTATNPLACIMWIVMRFVSFK